MAELDQKTLDELLRSPDQSEIERQLTRFTEDKGKIDSEGKSGDLEWSIHCINRSERARELEFKTRVLDKGSLELYVKNRFEITRYNIIQEELTSITYTRPNSLRDDIEEHSLNMSYNGSQFELRSQYSSPNREWHFEEIGPREVEQAKGIYRAIRQCHLVKQLLEITETVESIDALGEHLRTYQRCEDIKKKGPQYMLLEDVLVYNRPTKAYCDILVLGPRHLTSKEIIQGLNEKPEGKYRNLQGYNQDKVSLESSDSWIIDEMEDDETLVIQTSLTPQFSDRLIISPNGETLNYRLIQTRDLDKYIQQHYKGK